MLSKSLFKSSPTLFLAGVAVLAAAVGCSHKKAATEAVLPPSAKTQETYDSPDAAVAAFVQAVESKSNTKFNDIFGPGGEDLIDSGDKAQDEQRAEKFLSRFGEKHDLVANSNGSMTLTIGAEGWPFPIPLVHAPENGKWVFDTAAGKDEILDRRIGHNEMGAMNVCRAIVDAQYEYARRTVNGEEAGPPRYARRFVSDSGKHNGLYWETKAGEAESPLGPLIGAADADAPEKGKPYMGYVYRILTSQGANAAGGQYDYLVGDALFGGFAVLAYPAEYGNSGVMTFMIAHDGVLYQRDLGKDTVDQAKKIKVFDPDSGWEKAK